MNFFRDNQERIFLGLVIAGMFAMAAFIGISYRGGQAWKYADQIHLNNIGHQVLAETLKTATKK